jgi:threonine aldolase
MTTEPLNLGSDNVAGVAPEVMAALAAANHGNVPSYGADAVTARVEKRFAEIFETEVAAFPVATGTIANALALASLVPPYGAVLCHRESHINLDECGAPELFTGGAKLLAFDGKDGKLHAAALAEFLGYGDVGFVHRAQPAAISITQSTELGTVYGPHEVRELAELAHGAGLALHMDGARFANAVASLGCNPAEITWKAGVDALSFGGTKNGAMAAEAVIFFGPRATAAAAAFPYHRKRAGQLFSKMRFVSAQLDALLAGDLWLRHARHANAQAVRLAAALAALPGVVLLHPVQANEIFLRLPEPALAALETAKIGIERWLVPGGPLIRLVTAFDTPDAAVDAMIGHFRRATGA